jgi:hypothetical protein
MLNQLNGIRARLIALIITGLLLAPLAGLASAMLFGLITAAELQSLRTLATLAGFAGLVTCLAFPTPSSASWRVSAGITGVCFCYTPWRHPH